MNATSASHDLQPGDRVGEYEIVGVLGRGGFAVVYEGVHPVIGKRVAVKVLHARHTSGDGVARFVQEAQAVNQIAHDNIVDVFSLGQLPDGKHFFVMDLLRGTTLDRLIAERGRLPLLEALPILRGIARALDAAHARLIAHRDLKPENVFIAVDDHGTMVPKLLDFGLAKHLGALVGGPETQSGVLMGTPAYMSPEQARGRNVDHRTDIYSFGVLAYEMLTGRVPFTGDDHLAVLVKHTADAPPPPSSVVPELDERIDRAILSLLEKDPEARPKTLADAVLALEAAASGSSVTGPRPAAASAGESTGSRSTGAPEAPPGGRRRWLVGAAIAGGLVAVALLASRGSGEAATRTRVETSTGAPRGAPAAPVAILPAAAATAPPSGSAASAALTVPPGATPRVPPAPSARAARRPGSHSPNLDDVEDPFAGR
jgi:serine/threonine-protein kinase